VKSGLPVGAASERSFGAMSGGAALARVHAEDSGLVSEASFGALSCGGASFGRSDGWAGDGDVASERSFGALSGGVRSERSGALSEVSFGGAGGGSVAGVSYARSEGCGASLSSEEGDGGGGGVKSGLPVGAASERSFGAMSGGAALARVHAEDSGLVSEASFGALSFDEVGSFCNFVVSVSNVSDSFRCALKDELVKSMIQDSLFFDGNSMDNLFLSAAEISPVNRSLSSRVVESSSCVGICGIGVSVEYSNGCFYVTSLSPRGSAYHSRSVAIGNRLLAINGQF
jgi:hypothetical protein